MDDMCHMWWTQAKKYNAFILWMHICNDSLKATHQKKVVDNVQLCVMKRAVFKNLKAKITEWTTTHIENCQKGQSMICTTKKATIAS
jgi:hypothetical protein